MKKNEITSTAVYFNPFEYNKKEYDKDEDGESYFCVSGYYIGRLTCRFNIYGPYKGRPISGFLTCRFEGRDYSINLYREYTNHGMMLKCAWFCKKVEEIKYTW